MFGFHPDCDIRQN